MNMHTFSDGVNCTMLAPIARDNTVDYSVLAPMVDWYLAHGCSSLFAMCHSTELNFLSMQERLHIIKHVADICSSRTAHHGKKPDVIAAGTFSTDIPAMAEEILAISQCGADAVVLITNRLDPQNQGDAHWIRTAEALIERVPASIALGMYECPFPYKRLLSPEIIKWALATERFFFIKDTCCDPNILKERLSIVRGTQMKLFNANAQTLLYSLKEGAAGYSSVMANVHPELYAWLCMNFNTFPEVANHLQHVLCFTSFVESLSYPLIAKYYMRRQGVPIEIASRTRDANDFSPYHAFVMDQLAELTKYEYDRLPNVPQQPPAMSGSAFVRKP
jgi:4-hydroxy-tetrahydrodipicolinate synthase